MRSNSSVGAYILIILGAVFLLQKRGWMPGLGPLIAEWWPVILIIVGVAMLVRRSSRNEAEP